jgi:signal transduction histidine kinase
MNLATNAIQHTPKQGRITVEPTSNDCQAILQVQDTGIGIAEVDQAYIFDRFYRVNSDCSRERGSGLGLSIAQAIVQAHQSTLQVQSMLGQGSTFTVRLPLLKKNLV